MLIKDINGCVSQRIVNVIKMLYCFILKTKMLNTIHVTYKCYWLKVIQKKKNSQTLLQFVI